MNVFFNFSLGMTEIFSVGLAHQHNSFLQTHFSMAEELFLLNQENSYVVFNQRQYNL